jgi:hypothetical protein
MVDAMMLFLLSCTAEEPSCTDWCDLVADCGPQDCRSRCGLFSERDVDEWTECVAAQYGELDVAEYGWDHEACVTVDGTCHLSPGY